MNGKINNIEQICSVKRLQYTTGRAKGIEVMIVNNGRLCFELLVDKCLDVHSCYHRGTSVAFVSSGGLNSAESDFGSAFNGGLLYTCGLDTIGGRVEPVHGRIHNIRAEVNKVEVSEEGVEIVGTVKACDLFGAKLQLVRTVKTAVNSDTIEIIDEIKNIGYFDAEYNLLYHTNFGYPFIDEGVKFFAPITATVPRTEHAKEKMNAFSVMSDADDYFETVYYHTLTKGEATVTNEKLKKVAKVEYDKEVFPYFVEWRSMVGGAYALGLEPTTSTLDEEYKTQILKPNESIKAGLKITVSDL